MLLIPMNANQHCQELIYLCLYKAVPDKTYHKVKYCFWSRFLVAVTTIEINILVLFICRKFSVTLVALLFVLGYYIDIGYRCWI